MTETGQEETTEIPVRRRRRGRLGIWPLLSALMAATFVALVLMSVSGVPVRLPSWLADRIEAQMNASLPQGRLHLDRVELLIDPDGMPRVRLRNVEIADGAGNPVAQLNQIGAAFTPAALLRGRVEPKVVRLSGAQITVRRNTAGEIALAFGGMGMVAASGTLAGVLDAIDGVFGVGPLADLARIEASELTITLEDARSGRIWQATDGTLTLTNEDDSIGITVVSEVFNGTEDLAQLQLSFRSVVGSPAASLGVTFANAAASDIALQSPALAFLGPLDAPISGSMRATVNGQGTLDQLAATLEIGAGALKPSMEARPIRFDRARIYLDYDPASGRIRFPEISSETDLVSVSAEGSGFLPDLAGGWPETMTGQFRITRLAVASGDVFEGPVAFASGMADLRLRLDPFALDIGQLALEDAGDWRRVRGRIGVGEKGWEVALDLATDTLSPARLLELWPVAHAPGTRRWISGNVAGGTIRDLAASVRVRSGEPPVVGLSYRFEDAEVRVMRNLPPLVGGTGRASLHAGRYAMALEHGTMRGAPGVEADLSRTTFVVPDVRIKPAPAEVRLAAAGPLGSVLTLLDNPPFEILRKTRRPEDVLAIDAQADLDADIRFPLKPRIVPEDVRFEVSGTLNDFSTDRLIPGRRVASERLEVAVTPGQLTVTGPAEVDGVRVTATWSRPLGPGAVDAGSELAAQVDLSAGALSAFGVPLPPGTVTGSAMGELRIRLRPDVPAEFTLRSDLVGAGIDVPVIGWSKAARTPGTLDVSGWIGEGVEIQSLALSAPGLAATGAVEAGQGPGRATARFDRVRVGAWLDAPVTLVGRGPGRPPEVRIAGGEVDLRALPAGRTGRGTGGAPLRLALDRLRVSDTISLTDVRAELTTGVGLSGSFDARVNGGTPVQGTVVPAGNGTALRLRAENGGGALQDAGLIRNAREGKLELILMPWDTARSYDGQLRIERVRLRDAPLLAGLLDAVSIVGILDQMEGPGILFDTVEARFDLTPERLVVREGSAVGASLGISLDGVYDLVSKRMDLQGVISPIYLLNGIGQIFTRRGEGVFGFSFRVTGPQGATRVEVNPLSILTPGMFREIFRRPLPDDTR